MVEAPPTIEPRRRPLARALVALGPFLALILLYVGFGIAYWARNHGPDGFAPWSYFSYHNACLILAQSAIVAIAACGMTMIIVSGGIDLSVGSAIALCSMATALVLDGGHGAGAGIAAAVACGIAVGAFNGGIIAATRIMPFIVTLGTLSIARGVAQRLGHDATVNYRDEPAWFASLMQPYPFDRDPSFIHNLLAHPGQVVAPGVWLAVAAVALTTVVMSRSVFGRHLYAIGSNEAAARLCGIRVQTTKMAIYACAGAFTGLAGTLTTAKLHVGDPTIAAGAELDVIAAVVLGGASLTGGVGTPLGAVIGALLMGVLRNGSQQLGWENSTQLTIVGAIIIIAVGVDRLRQRKAPGS